jgi:hypothetical protein
MTWPLEYVNRVWAFATVKRANAADTVSIRCMLSGFWILIQSFTF